MPSLHRDSIVTHIHAKEDEMSKLKDLMIARIAELAPAAYRMMTAQQLSTLLGVPNDDAFKEVLDDLSSGDGSPLEAWGMLDGHEDALEDDDFAQFRQTGELIHPVYGEPVLDASNAVAVYYAVRAREPAQPTL